jgi:hypothetical protein
MMMLFWAGALSEGDFINHHHQLRLREQHFSSCASMNEDSVNQNVIQEILYENALLTATDCKRGLAFVCLNLLQNSLSQLAIH